MSTLLQFLKDTKIDFTKAIFEYSSGGALNYNNFDITPKEFLRFAKEDLETGGTRGIINAITNSKRAIDCQIEEVLIKLSVNTCNQKHLNKLIQSLYSDVNTHHNLKVIHSLNLAPTLLISKTRNIRNKLEHLYQCPLLEEAQEALDVAELFIKTVDGQMNTIIEEFIITDEKNYKPEATWNAQNGIGFRIDYGLNNFHIDILKILDSKIMDSIIINNQSEEFPYLLRLVLSQGDDFELTQSLKLLLETIKHPLPLKHINISEV